MAAVWLSDEELQELTKRERAAAQARALDALKVPYKRRPDGSLVVGRLAVENALAGIIQGGKTATPEANGLNWN
jgi:hypothetical protein